MSNYIESLLDDELNILIVSTNNSFLTKLQNLLHSKWKEQLGRRCFRCKIHVTPDISTVKNATQINFDFYIFILEMSIFSCIKDVEANLNLLDSFGRQKITLVAQRGKVDNVTPEELWAFARFYQLNLLFGDIEIEDKAAHLCTRLLNLVESSCGVLNGTPLVGNI